MGHAIIDLNADAKPAAATLATKALTGAHEEMFRPKFPDEADVALEKVLMRLRANSRNRPGEFKPTFLVGARGGGKSQALLEVSMRVLDDIEDDDSKRTILPIIVYCSSMNWNQDISDIADNLEREIVGSISGYFRALAEAAGNPSHVWGLNRKNLTRIAELIPLSKIDDLLNLSLREIADPLVDDGVTFVVMMEDFDKVGASNSVSFLSGAQNELEALPVQMVFTMQPSTFARAADDPGCNWAISTGARFSGEEKINLPDLGGESRFVRDALKSRMEHVVSTGGDYWAFQFDSSPNQDLSRFNGVFASIDDLFRDKGIAKIIEISSNSDYIESGAIRNVLRAAQIVLNKLRPESPEFGPIQVIESVEEDSPKHLQDAIDDMVKDLDDEQVENLFSLHEWIAEQENFDIFVEGMHAARHDKRDHREKASSRLNAIDSLEDAERKKTASRLFKLLGLISTEDEPDLGVVSNFFRDQCCREDLWINDSTPAICNHFRNALRRPIEDRNDSVILSRTEADAAHAPGKGQWGYYYEQIRKLVVERQATLSEWGKIPPAERQEIIIEWLSDFDHWLVSMADAELQMTHISILGEGEGPGSPSDEQISLGEKQGRDRRINHLFNPLSSKIAVIFANIDKSGFDEKRAIERAEKVYRHFFKTRGLEADAWKLLTQLWSNSTEGLTPLDLRDHLSAIVEASLREPVPIPILENNPRESYCEVRILLENTPHGKSPKTPPTWIIFPSRRYVGKKADDQLSFIEKVLKSVQEPPLLPDRFNGEYDILGEFREISIWTYFDHMEQDIFFRFVAKNDLQQVFRTSEGEEFINEVYIEIAEVNWRPMPGNFEADELEAIPFKW